MMSRVEYDWITRTDKQATCAVCGQPLVCGNLCDNCARRIAATQIARAHPNLLPFRK